MSAALRKALFWLVMLAFPLQGLATTGVSLHALGHGVMQMVPEAATHATDNPSSTQAHALADCAGPAKGCEDCQSPGVVKCGLSAACAIVAAPGLQMRAPLQKMPAVHPTATPPNPFAGFCTGAPDRPPRSFI